MTSNSLNDLVSFITDRVEMYGLYAAYLKDTEETLAQIDAALKQIQDTEQKEAVKKSLGISTE